MSHYFIEDNLLTPDIKHFTYNFMGIEFQFSSNSGIFSHGHVDPASSILIQKLPEMKGSLLDLGCGFGPIGIVLTKINTLALTLADVNGNALTLARENCEANGVDATIIKSDCFQNITDNFNQIVLNPPIHAGKSVVFQMYFQSYEHLHSDGKLYLVIQKKHGAISTISKLTEVFDNCEILYKKKGYYILECTKS